MQLSGRNVVLTGASYGLGAHIARALAAGGARLALVARSRERLEALAAELRGAHAGGEAVVVQADLTEPDAPWRVVRLAEDALGPTDVLVNNAGVEHTERYERLDPAEIERLLDLNVRAPLLLTRLVLPGMLERGRGRIVNIASLAGKVGPAHHEGYSASKAALIAFTRSLRASYHGTGVSASAVVPGFVRGAGMHQRKTERTGVRAPGLVGTVSPADVADAVLEAIRGDRPEIVVAPAATRAMYTALGSYPRVSEWIVRRLGVNRMYGRMADADE